MYHIRSPSLGADGGVDPAVVTASCITATASPFEVACAEPTPPGTLELFRQSAFKGEPLVPVVPSAYALVLVPDSAVDPAARPDDVARDVSGFLARVLSDSPTAARSVEQWVSFTLLQCHLAPSSVLTAMQQKTTPASRYAVLCDATRLAAEDPAALTDVYADGGNVILELLSAVAGSSAPFNPALSQQFAVAFACDPRPDAFSSAAWYALPTCLSCLDRLDRLVSGLRADDGPCRCALASGGCLCYQLRDPTTPPACPACAAVRGATQVSAAGAPALTCARCGATDDLWTCLVCGFVGCSRYRAEHAKEHGEAMRHDFALSVVSQQIWDYPADTLAHRLIMAYDADDGGAAQPFVLPERDEVAGAGSVDAKVVEYVTHPPPMDGDDGGDDPAGSEGWGGDDGDDGAWGAASPSSAPRRQQQQHHSDPHSAGQPQRRGGGGSHQQPQQRRDPAWKPGDAAKKPKKGGKANNSGSSTGFPSRVPAMGGGNGNHLPHKYLVDAKLESKVEEVCLTFTRDLVGQLEAQRRALAASSSSPSPWRTATPAPSESHTATTTTASAVAERAATAGVHTVLSPLGPGYAAWNVASDRAAARWTSATAGAAAVVDRHTRLEGTTRDLEAAEQRLTAEQEQLKRHLKDSLLRKHQEGQLAEKRRARIRELQEMVAEAQLNLDARQRVADKRLSAADQASSFVTTSSSGSRGSRRRR